MSYSFSIQDEGGGGTVTMSSYGVIIEDYELPIEGEPDSYTVNVPGMTGGYTYVNEVKPATLTIQCQLTAADNDTLIGYAESIAAALVTTNKYQIHIDGIYRYWIGRRISGILSPEMFGTGVTSARFPLLFSCEDPTSYPSGGT